MSKKEWIIIVAIVIVGSVATGGLIYRNHHNIKHLSSQGNLPEAQSHSTYNLNLMGTPTNGIYPVNQPTTLTFDIKDQNNNVFKNFAVDYTKLVHLIVVRKDRTNFQHVHPTYDSKSGIFTLTGFEFPTDGDYRIFANFTPTGAQKDSMGMVLSVAPYQDIKVGDMSKYTPIALGQDKISSTVNGFTASLLAPGTSTIGSPTYYAQHDTTATVYIQKDGQLFKSLQEYLGSLGHMVILGPNLEFIHAHPLLDDVNSQTGKITFMVNFPSGGQYKLYLQTQADNQVTTHDFNLTVMDMPKSSSDSMSGMQM